MCPIHVSATGAFGAHGLKNECIQGSDSKLPSESEHVTCRFCHQFRPTVQKMFHGLVVPFGTSGLVQVDRPLVLVPLVPRRSEDLLLLVPLVPLRSEDPLLLVPLVPRTPT